MNVEQFLAWRLRSLLALFASLRGAGKERGRVLFLLTGGIGDKLMALPAIRQFRQEFPSKPLTLIVMGIAPPFFATEADHIIQLGMDDTAGLLREARRGFDACFVNSVGIFEVRLELAAFLSGARDLRGPKFPGAGRSLYSRPYDFGVGHETAINLRGAGGTPSEDRVPYLLTMPPDAKSEKVPDVIFHPGSSAKGLTNRWPAENYAETARQLRAAGLSVLAIGTPGEKDLLGNLQNLAGEALTTRTDLSLEQLAIFLSRARLVIANDSGIGHLAAAVGAPLLTIIGSSRPEKIAPVGSRVTVIGPRCEYGGCYNNPNVPECKMCIARITPDEVVQTALTKLAA